MSKKRPRVSLRSALRQTDETAMYPGCGQGTGPALAYVGLGLAGEAGEVANQLKKVMRDDGGLPTPSRSAKLFDELGDVMWYWLRCCRELGFDPYDVVLHNLTKLEMRATNGTLQGDTAADGSRGGVGIPESFIEGLDSMLVDDAAVPQPTEEQSSAPVFPVASLELLRRMKVTRWAGRRAFVVDEQVTYEMGVDGNWHPVEDNSGAEPRAIYDDPKLAYDDLVTHDQKPGSVDVGSQWGARVLHVLTCRCTCAVGGTAWVVSGYRELGVVQDMYAHLREAHTNPGAVVMVEG